jgi:GNAT superfamily N-acetyltransferase
VTGNPAWDADAVLAASNEWSWVPDGAPHVRTDELLVVAYPDHFLTPTVARVFGSGRDPVDLVDEVHAIARGFGRHRLWWSLADRTRPPGLEAEVVRRGGAVVERMDVLALVLNGGAPALGAPAGVTVRRVTGPGTARDALLVSQAAFGGPDPTDEMVVESLAELRTGLDDGSNGRVVAYLDGRAASTGGWTMAGDVCRLWGAGTHPDLRGRGAYRAILAARIQLASQAGATLALTHGRVETSSPILRRVGFKRFGEQRQLVIDL